MLLLAEGLRTTDWLVLALYGALIIGAGVWSQVKQRSRNATDYFLAGRHMPVWAVAVSTIATVQSAATFVGVPQDSYANDLTYFSASIGALLAAVLLARFVIPSYYRLGVGTPYQLLESRFGPGAKLATSWAYLIGRVFASGSRVYVGAIPVAIAFFGDRPDITMMWVIAGIMVFSVLYTLWGGLDSVIWTDVVQVVVYVGAALAAVIVLWKHIPAPASDILNAWRQGMPDGSSKLTLVRTGLDSAKPLGFDPGAPFTVLTALTGWTLLNLAAFGTDQDLVQRLLACRGAKQGGRSIIASTLLGIPVVMIFAAVGLLLWIVYARPDLMGRPTPEYAAGDSADVFLKFVMREMPAGAAGLVVAGVIAAGPAGVNASLNSMAGTLVSDFYRPVVAPGRDEAHYVKAGRWAVVLWGLVLGGFAVVCIWWQRHSGQSIIDFVLGVMAFAYAGLLGVFFTALFTRRGTTASAVAAMLVGFVAVFLLQPPVWKVWTAWSDWTATNLAAVRIASPWRLVIGAALATLVAAAPRGKALAPGAAG